jgi:DNA-binding SARP family transcriptional activator
MRLRLLGDSTIELGAREVTPTSPALFALLLRLSADCGRPFQRDELATLLFPKAPSANASAHSVRQLLYHAMRLGAPIVKRGSAISVVSDDVLVDVNSAAALDAAVASDSVRGLAILPGYFPHLSPQYDGWVDEYRQHHQTRVRHALVLALEENRRRANWRSVEWQARACLAIDEFNESATLALAEALARSGSKEKALATLDSFSIEVGARDRNLALPAQLLRRRIDAKITSEVNAIPEVRFVARGDHLALLHDQWRRVRAGAASCTLVRGEPGSGKTRLIEEYLAQIALSKSANLAVLREGSAERFRPWSLWSKLVPSLQLLPGAAGCDPALLPFLSRLSSPPSSTWEGQDSPGQASFISASIGRALVDLLSSISGERPCLLVIDDSRAIDDVSLEFLGRLFSLSPSLRLFVLIACEATDTREELLRLPQVTSSLEPLSEEHSRMFVREYFAEAVRVVSEAELTWCNSVASGNPGFLMLACAQCASASGDRDVPKDILTIVDRRIASLSASARVVLEACAVLGDDSNAIVLSGVLDVPTIELVGVLRELERGGLIEYQHERIRLRGSLLLNRVIAAASHSALSVLHARSAEALEATTTTTGRLWRVAIHWRNAGEHRRSRIAFEQSWRKSIQLGQPAFAEASIRECLALATSVLEKTALLDDLIEVTKTVGDSHATIRAIDERIALSRLESGDTELSEQLAFDRLDALLSDSEDPSSAERDLTTFMHSTVLDTTRRLRAIRRLMMSADATANPAMAAAAKDGLLSLPVDAPEARASSNQALLIYHTVFGSPALARSLALDTIAVGRLNPNNWLHISGRVNASLALQVVGDASDALRELEDCYPAVVSTGVSSSCILVASRMASFALDDGDMDSAISWSHRAKTHIPSNFDGRLPSEYLSVNADLALLNGEFGVARQFIAMMRNNTPLYRAPRYRTELLSYSHRLHHYEGRRPPAEEVTQLLKWHYRARSYGRHDDIMEALWTSLVADGRSVLASSLLLEYLAKCRRETRGCRHMLAVLTATDPAWEKLRSAHEREPQSRQGGST